MSSRSPRATHVDVVGKILYLRPNYHFGPGEIAMRLKRYHYVEVSKSGIWRTGGRPPTAARYPPNVRGATIASGEQHPRG
ncbi:MAG TPA: hypothetical protein VGJ59_19660 [Jatrophihabitantaceae bacterium]|jgi:hypothetical protein